jgi:hypothetical protein
MDRRYNTAASLDMAFIMSERPLRLARSRVYDTIDLYSKVAHG